LPPLRRIEKGSTRDEDENVEARGKTGRKRRGTRGGGAQEARHHCSKSDATFAGAEGVVGCG